MKVLYEVNWHQDEKGFSHCSVTYIKLLWRGIRPGCYAESIRAIDSNGNEFIGSPGSYYETEDQAWQAAIAEIEVSIASDDALVARVTEKLARKRTYLQVLKDNKLTGEAQ